MINNKTFGEQVNMEQRQTGRVHFIDELRGVFLIIIVLYHLLYDIDMLLSTNHFWTQEPLIEAVRWVAASSFIVIAGISCHFTRSNIRRGIKTLGWAMAITLITYVFMPHQVIWFGILHLLGLCMLTYGAAFPALKKIPPPIGIILSLLLFVLTYRIFHGTIGLGDSLRIALPESWYSKGYLFPLGFGVEGYFSSDYYPVMPWMFLFGFGFYLGNYITCEKLPAFFCREHNQFLGMIGKKTLMIYLLHQPILYTIVWLISKV